MAGYIFAVSQDGWNRLIEENIKSGHFSPLTPEITEEYITPEKARTRKAINKVLAAVFGDLITMKPGDNIYFLSKRKIYGTGKLVSVGEDCVYDNYLNASALLPDCQLVVEEPLTAGTTRSRWVFFFEPSPYFFKKGADMDDVLKYRPEAFKMLRAFENVTFIKIDDEENRALKEYISLINEGAYSDLDSNTFPFSPVFHSQIRALNLNPYKMDISKALQNHENKEFVISEMFVEAALLQTIARESSDILGQWQYASHQLIASPFKPLTYIDKIDVFGYRFSQH